MSSLTRAQHPSPDRLRRWLETGEPERVGRHVNGCETCMAFLDDDSRIDPEVVADLTSVLAAPDGTKRRASRGIAQRRRDREATSVLVDLFTVAGSWTRLMLDDDPEVSS